jgi:hypothetical protein
VQSVLGLADRIHNLGGREQSKKSVRNGYWTSLTKNYNGAKYFFIPVANIGKMADSHTIKKSGKG